MQNTVCLSVAVEEKPFSGLCDLLRWLDGGALTWSESVHCGCWLYVLLGGAGQGQPLLLFCLGPPSMSYRTICWCPLLVLGFEVPRRGQVVNQGQLPLVLSLRPLSKRSRACWGHMLLVWEILGKSEAWTKTGYLCGKATGTAYWVVWGLRDSPGMGKQWERLRHGISQYLCREGAQQKGATC